MECVGLKVGCKMRIVVAQRTGRRGAGLGNELVPWAKGMIASRVLDAKLVGPSWGLNDRKYYRNFGTSRLDFVAEEILRRLPHYAFTEKDYFESGETDFGHAITRWADRNGLLQKGSYIVTVDGMYGGYPAIWNARPAISSKLMESRDAWRNLHEITSVLDRNKLFVALHMRLHGDFAVVHDEEMRGRFNVLTPGKWYLRVCETLQQHFGERIEFRIFTDIGGPEFDEVVRRFNPGQVRQHGLTECSDLLLMAQADLRVCSVSSYSLVASWLSDGPYLWYEPQLSLLDGQYTLWGNEKEQQLAGSLTELSRAAMREAAPGPLFESCFKGYPGRADGTIPAGLIAQLERRLMEKANGNLLAYGAVPAWVV